MSSELDLKSYWVTKTANDALLGKQAEQRADPSKWVPAPHTKQTLAAEAYNRGCRIGKQKPGSPSIYFFPDFGEDDA